MVAIYLHRNKTNGKCYVGQTSQQPNNRWKYGYGYKNCPLFYNAILKYGWDNFEHIILAKVNDEDADELERYYICKYDCLKNGYNLDLGGKLNKHHSEETKKKMSEKAKGRIISKQQREKLSQKLKGRKLPQEVKDKISLKNKGRKPYEMTDEIRQHHSQAKIGFKHTEQTKLKISKHSPRLKGIDNPHSKGMYIINVIEKTKEYVPCISIVERMFNIPHSTMFGLLNNKRRYKDMYIFEYKNKLSAEYNEYVESCKAKVKSELGG